MKRPKDMTREELIALPVVSTLNEPTNAIHWQMDDLMLWGDQEVGLWTFGQKADGSWYKIPAHL